MIIDTHIHLYDDRYQNELDEIINEAITADVKKMIIVGYDQQTSIKAIELADKYDFMYASVGLHPSEVHKEVDSNLNWIYQLIEHPKVVAIGECGLDLYWDKTYKEKQIDFFINNLK